VSAGLDRQNMDPRLERRILDRLYEKGMLDADERRSLEAVARRKGVTPLSYIMVQGYVPDVELAGVIGEVVGLPVQRLEERPPDPETLARQVPLSLAKKFHVVPVGKGNGQVTVAVPEPLPMAVLNNLTRITRSRVRQVISPRQDIYRWLAALYKVRVEEETLDHGPTEVSVGEDVVRAIDDIMRQALEERASDIHFEPLEERMRVRFRVDGMLRERAIFAIEQASQVIARLKVLSHLDIAEKREPQDGGFSFEGLEEAVDVRVSILPCIHGEKAVLRLLMGKRARITLEKLGLDQDDLEVFKDLIRRPYGIILVTGPTGSGKSTTLYAALSLVQDESVNISTIEDPVEYQMAGITQTQVDSASKVTFAKALRSLLRQDPDIIMVGEIRDKETAEIALRAAMTGHLVFSTLHTNDAPSSITRLLDMGCEPFLVASSVVGIMAQRLVRVLCPACKQPYEPDEMEMRLLGISEKEFGRQRTWYRAVGCPRCQMTGYRGRSGVFELMTLTQGIRELVVKGASFEDIRRLALGQGMKSLRMDAIGKVERGVTSVEEAIRVTILD